MTFAEKLIRRFRTPGPLARSPEWPPGPTRSGRLLQALRLCREYRGLRLPYDAPHHDPTVLAALDTDSYEAPEIQAVHQVLCPGDRVLELGGGMGVVSAYIARDPRSVHVDVVEANPALVPAIRALHAANGVAHKTTVHAGAASATAAPRRFVPGADLLSGATDAGDTQEAPPALAVPDLLRSTGAQLLVMDIEGHELPLLQQVQHLGQLQRMVMEVHPAIYGATGITALLQAAAGHGFHYSVDGSHKAVLVLRRD